MKSEELGLPLFYQQYPEYFDTPSNQYYTQEKNAVIEGMLNAFGVKTVFDMTCGTGAQVLHLARLGYTVVGSDFSPGLLEIARKKASEQAINVQFIDGDMRDVQLGEFDAVITIDNAIGHLTKDDFEIAIRNIYNNLKSSGLFIFDILNLDAMNDEVIGSDSKRMTDTRVTADGTTIHNIRRSTIDRAQGYLTSTNMFTIQRGTEQKKIENQCTLQIYTVQQLKDILSRNGFEIVEQHKVDAYTFHKDHTGYSILTVAQKQ